MPNATLIVRSLFVFFLFASPVLAASITVTPTGNPASFSVMGTDMDGTAGIQLDISYDETSLATPTVTQGNLVAGAMLAANTSRPGLIKIAIISTRTFSGSGQIATITFASKKGNGSITSISSSMIDSKGSPLTSSAINTASEAIVPLTSSIPGVPFSQPTQQASSPTAQQGRLTSAATGTVSTSTPTYPGIITLPTEQQPRGDSQPAPQSPVPTYTGEPAAVGIAEQSQPAEKQAADTKAEVTPQRVVYKGVLDRFKQYKGSKDFSAFVALFNKKVAQTAYQEPALVLSDGQSKVTLTVDIPTRTNSSPNFAVDGGTLTSFKQDPQSKGRWIIEVLPQADSMRVAVTIMAGADEYEFPLALAPRVKTALPLDESGWNRFIKEVGTTTAPLHDFNNDGVRNYVDEFIFVANYVAGKSIPSKPPLISQKPGK